MTGAALHLGLVGPIPPPNGGMAMQTEQLGRLLQGEGLQVSRVATNAPYRPAFIERLPGVRAAFRLLPYLLAVWRLAGKVDVIHLMANSGWSWQLHAAPVLWLAWLRGCPVIVNYRGGEARAYFQRAFRWVRPSLNRAAAVVVPSGYLQEVFREFDQATTVVPNIIDRELFRPQPEAQTGKSYASARPHYTLVTTRNLEPIYGTDTALRALARVHAAGCPAQLRIAGSGPAEPALRQLVAELGLQAAVHFEGRLDRAGIVALYAAADAMVNPTTVDNMPNSVLEAMACGVPVVSTDVGGVSFILTDGETGLLVPTGDAEALAEAILRLHGDAALQQRLRANALAQVEQYTWPRVRPQWIQAYATACTRRATA